MKINALLFLAMISIFLVACDDEVDPPVDTCETADLTYTSDIASIIDESCATAGCHEMGSSTTFEMHDYATTKAAVDFGRIIGAINHETGFIPMPFPVGSDMIAECDIDQLTAWINDGAPE